MADLDLESANSSRMLAPHVAQVDQPAGLVVSGVRRIAVVTVLDLSSQSSVCRRSTGIAAEHQE